MSFLDSDRNGNMRKYWNGARKKVSGSTADAPPVAGTSTGIREKAFLPRTGFFFYLICLVAILWAVFLLVREEMPWVSIFLVLVSAGMVIFVYFLSDSHLVSKPGTGKNSTPIASSGSPVPGLSGETDRIMDPEGG